MVTTKRISRVLRWLLLGLVLGSIWSAGAERADAAPATGPFDVNSTVDAVDAHPGDGRCETASGNGICTLRAAIMESNALGTADTINLQPYTFYTLSIPGDDDNAAMGDLDIKGALTIQGNGSVIDANGLGDRIFDMLPSGKNVNLWDMALVNGSTGDWGGGAIYNEGATVYLGRVRVMDNQARNGGGIYNSTEDAHLTLYFSSLSDNKVSESGGEGGGLYNAFGRVEIYNSTINGNRGDLRGGGIASENGEVRLVGSTVYANWTGNYGGGIWNSGSTTGSAIMTLVNSTVANNYAGLYGGGIYNDEGGAVEPAVLILYNASIVNNVAAHHLGGGGVMNQSQPGYLGYTYLTNSLIAGNREVSKTGPWQDCNGTLTSKDYNLIQSMTGCGMNGDKTHTQLAVDAKIGSLHANGGQTSSVQLYADSPAIDGGNPNGCLDDLGALLTTDQRGYLRPAGAACDIGAYEANAWLTQIFVPIVVR